MNFKYRMHDPRTGRFFAIDPLSSSYPYNSPYAFSENSVIAFIELEGLEKYSIHTRSFIPTAGAGVWPYKFRGDGRGFSTDPANDLQGATSRIKQTLTINTDTDIITWNTSSDPTVRYSPTYAKEAGDPEGKVTKFTKGTTKHGNTRFKVDAYFQGSDPLAPGAPDVDVFSNFSLIQDDAKKFLILTANISGDDFPSMESFIEDEAGNKLFLGAYAATGSETSLFGVGDESLANITLTINTNDKGEFQSVKYGETTYSLADWNKLYTDQSAGDESGKFTPTKE